MDREAREAAGLALSERLGSPVSKKASSPRPKPAQSRPRSDGARFDERRERTDRPPRFQVRKIRFDDLSVNSEMLEKPVGVIPGIGPQNSRSMAKQGIYTVRDGLEAETMSTGVPLAGRDDGRGHSERQKDRKSNV